MSQRILLVDDDELMRRSLAFNLEQAGYRVSTAATGEDALAIHERIKPDLVLLDVGLPGMDGLQALRHLRQQSEVPVIFLTARRRELDEILGLELGADDYVTKPFDMDVLLARIRALLRRSQDNATHAGAEEALQVGDMVIDPAAHTVSIGERQVKLAAREFAVLHTLALEAGRVLPVDTILNRVWGAEFGGESQGVYVHIRWLREKIEEHPSQPKRIVTVRGVGYKLVSQPDPANPT